MVKRSTRSTQRLNLGRWITSGVVAAAMAMGGAAVCAQPAQADTGSCSVFYKAIPIRWVPTYRGSLCSNMVGQGGTVSAVQYTLGYTGTICDWWVDFDFRRAGQVYFHSQGAAQGCVTGRHRGQRFGGLPVQVQPADELCTTLYRRSEGVISRVVATCTYV